MRPINYDQTCYRIDGKPVYLNSGEFHYFRVPRADWRARMKLFKQAGGNCLAFFDDFLPQRRVDDGGRNVPFRLDVGETPAHLTPAHLGVVG